MPRLTFARGAAVLGMVLIALGGCGKSITTSAGAGASTPAYPTSTTAATTISQGTSTMTTTPPIGPVTVTVTGTRFALGDTMNITVDNNSSAMVMVADHQSFCSIFKVEYRKADGTWQIVSPCRLASPTRFIEISANAKLPQTLVLSGTDMVAGTYRIQLVASTTTSNSTEFTIG